jgi:hypothetical protein
MGAVQVAVHRVEIVGHNAAFAEGDIEHGRRPSGASWFFNPPPTVAESGT